MMQGLPSWLYPQAQQAGGPILPPQGGMGAPPPFGPGQVPMPPALTMRSHRAAMGGGARYGQAAVNPQGEWGSLARMLGMAPQTPPPVGGAAGPYPIGGPVSAPPQGGLPPMGPPGDPMSDPALAAGMAAGRMGGPPPVGPGQVPMPPGPGGPQASGPIGGPPSSVNYGPPPVPQQQDAGPPPPSLPGMISPAEAATPPEELQAPELSPGDVGQRAMAPGEMPAPRPPFGGRPPVPVPRPTPPDRPAADSSSLVAASSPPDVPMGGYTPPAPPGWGPAGPEAHGGTTGDAPGLPLPPDGGRPAPAPDKGGAEPTGWDKFKGFWTTPMGGDPTNGALAAMGLAPQAPSRLQALGSALAGFGGNMLMASSSRDPAMRRNALGFGLLGAGQGWAAPSQQYQQAMPGAVRGYLGLQAQLGKRGAPVVVGNALVDPTTGKPVYQGADYKDVAPGHTLANVGGAAGGTAPPQLTNPNPDPAMLSDADKLAVGMGLPLGSPEHAAFVQKFGNAKIQDMLQGHGTRLSVTPQIITNPENRASQLTYDMTKDQLKELSGGWAKAQSMQGDANTLANLAIHGQQAGGVLSPLKQQAVNLGQSLGLQLDPQTVAAANDTSLFDQLTNKLAPAMRVTGSGSSSDKDISMFKGALPSIKDTKEQQIMMSLAFKQMTDYTANQGRAVNAAIEHLGASGKLPTMSEAGQMATKAIGDSWLPRMSAKQVDAGGVFHEPTLYLDTDSGRIGYYMPGGG
jgi:hypothetical protein